MKYRKPKSKTSPRPVQKLTWRQHLALLRPALPGLAFVLLLMSAGGWLLFARIRFLQEDIEGVAVRSGLGTVLRKTVRSSSGRNGNLNILVSFLFRLDDRTVAVDAPDDTISALTCEGDRVPVTYRIGKSGSYYIVDWKPVPHKEPLPFSH